MGDVRVFVDGLHFGEGPRWHDGRLWYSDFYDHEVRAATPDGSVTTIVEVPEQPSGLGWLPDGRLLVVSMRDRTVRRLDPDGLALHADLSGVATFHANDMVVDHVGRAYVGNFGFDLHHDLEERGIEGVLADHVAASLALVEVDGSVRAVAGDLHFPNGSVITPDGATLIVAESLGGRLTAFDVAEDGTLSNRREWASLGGRVPDGICLDAAGDVWVANAVAPECVLVREGGEVVDTVTTTMPAFACALGGEDGRTLYVMVAPDSHPDVVAVERSGQILATEVAVPAAPAPRRS